MSADNFVYVVKTGNGRYGVFDCSASADDPLRLNKPVSVHDTPDSAIKAAHKLDAEGYYEYGVSIHGVVTAEWMAE